MSAINQYLNNFSSTAMEKELQELPEAEASEFLDRP